MHYCVQWCRAEQSAADRLQGHFFLQSGTEEADYNPPLELSGVIPDGGGAVRK